MEMPMKRFSPMQMKYLFDVAPHSVAMKRRRVAYEKRYFIERQPDDESGIKGRKIMNTQNARAYAFLTSLSCSNSTPTTPRNTELEVANTNIKDEVTTYTLDIFFHALGYKDKPINKAQETIQVTALISADSYMTKKQLYQNVVWYILAYIKPIEDGARKPNVKTDIHVHEFASVTASDIGSLKMNLSTPKKKELNKYNLTIDMISHRHFWKTCA